MKKRLLVLILILSLVLGGCGNAAPEKSQYTATFLTLFDTITTVIGLAQSEEAFSPQAQAVHDELEIYHRLFDIYHDYAGISNLKTVNDNAGIAPVAVDPIIISLLKDCKAYYDLTGGKVNVAMGSVLRLWHEARNDSVNDPMNAYLPDADALAEAEKHTGWDTILIDAEAGTVFITDPEQLLDVGAVAKGWAAQRVAEHAPEGLLISVGGNVCATGPKNAEGTPWVVGITDPEGGEGYLHTLYLSRGSVVTSGDYQRYYLVDGVQYHHIIDPATLYPSVYWCSVTVICEDSGLADALSTALFVLPQAEGQALLTACGAEAMWVDREGEFYYSPGFEETIRN